MANAAFLKKFGALCKKHQITIGACGCCGSPWVFEHGVDDNRTPVSPVEGKVWIEDDGSRLVIG